jgi:hypothetical protein
LLETTLARVENNVIFGVTSPLLPEGSYGLVAGYNYSLNTATGAQFGALEPHLSHNYLQLYEGNVLDEVMYDNSWGSSSQNTSFRNRLSGNSPNKTNFRAGVKINAQNHYMNIVGNVIGDPTFHTRYRCDNVDTSSSPDNFEYDLGFWNSCDAGSVNYDTVTESSLMRWGNWDAVTWKANGNTNGVRWCTGAGVGNSACTASERAESDPTFPGLSNPNTTLPASFYLPTKPSWFGNVIFPSIGPDVTCTTSCIVNTASHAAEIPAELCYDNSAKDANGFVTSFDANVCYYSSGTPPSAPTVLMAVVR